MPCVWNDWLPSALSEEIRTEEPQRFARVIRALAGIVFGQEGVVADHRPFAGEVVAGRRDGDQKEQNEQNDQNTQNEHRNGVGIERRRLAPEVVSSTLPYVPLVKGFLDAKAEPGLKLIQVLTSTLLAIVLSTEADLSAQARWGSVLHRVLRTHGKKLKKFCNANGEPFQIEWFPLYTQLRRHYLVMTPNYEGAGVMEARRQALVHLLHQSRRFFPEGSAMEIWEYFRPALRDPHSSEAFEAIGWMCMMLPTQEICSNGLDRAAAAKWQETVDSWLHTWGQRVHNQTWQSLWFGLLARLAKHDVYGVIDWKSNMRSIINRFLWAFHVPLGPASASPPFRAGAPAPIEALFANDMLSRSASTAKVLIWSIGRDDVRGTVGDEHGGDEDEDVALSCLENIVAIFEQYYHPSNGGKWSGSLALFLRNLCDNFCKRLVAEHSVMTGISNALHSIVSGGESEEEPSDEEDQDDEEDASMSGTGEAGADSSLSDDDMVGVSPATQANVAPQNAYFPRRHLTPHHRQAVVRLLMRLAIKGQSGKDSSMRRYSSSALSMLACVEPRIVLPEVQKHFVTALETVTAARQYGNAIQTLSLCVRPMLLCGRSGLDLTEPGTDDGAELDGNPMHVGTSMNIYDSISSAMVATLPGIDANDPPKSLAVFRLYCCVLSCVGPMQADADPYSTSNLYSEEWATELLSRIFAVIANVDSPDGGVGGGEHSSSNNKNDDGSSFLLDGNSMFRPLMELLFARLPEPFRTRTIKHTSEFLLGSTFSSVAPEAAILCNAMAWADADQTEKHMLAPLVSLLLEECESIRENSKLSKVQETTLCWRIGLLSSLVYHMGPQATAHGERIKSIFSVVLQSPSTTVHGAASRCLSSLLVGLCSYYPLRQYETCCGGESGQTLSRSINLEPFVDKFGDWDLAESTANIPAPAWHEPSEAEIALSNDVLATFLEQPSDRILEAEAMSREIPKLEMRSIMVTLEGCLEGTRSCLPDFEGQHKPGRDEMACVVGKLGATVGSGALRSKVGRALISASKMIQSNDVETQMYLMRVLDCLLSVGCAEFLSSDSSASAWASDDKWLQQPSVSGFLLESDQGGVDQGASESTLASGCVTASRLVPWRRRRPRWIAIEKVFMNLEWRASQCSYRSFASVDSPLLPVDMIPEVYVDALALAVHYMLNGGSHVRDVSSNLVEKCAKRYPLLSKHISASVCAGIAKIPDYLSFNVGVSCVELLPPLIEAAQNSAQRAAEAAASGVPESEEEQSIGAGAAALLRWISSWRYFTRDYHGLRAIVLALISSFAYQGPEAQISMTMAQLMLALRSMRPTDDPGVADLICMDCVNIVQNSRDGTSPSLSGKHETITILFPLFLLPDISPSVAAKLVDMYARALVSDTPLVRRVSQIAIEMILLPLWKPHEGEAYSSETPHVSAAAVEAARESLASILEREGETLLPKFIQMLSTSHHNMASSADDGQTQRMRGMGAGKEETIVAAALNTLLKGLEWPISTAGFKAITEGSFTVRHARLTQVLTQVNPAAVFKHLKLPIEESLSKSQDADKPAVAATAEVLAGILASGCFMPCSSKDGNDADATWVLPALQRGLETAPLDFLNVWADCVLRFGINGIKEKVHVNNEGIRSIIDAALSNKPFAEGVSGPPSDVYRRVTYMTEILQEVLGDATGKFPIAPTLGQGERELLSEILAALPSLIETGCDTDLARQAIAGLTADACMVVMTMASDDKPGMIKMADLKAKVDEILDSVYAQFDASAEYLFEMNKDKAVDGAVAETAEADITNTNVTKAVLEIANLGGEVSDVAGLAEMVDMVKETMSAIPTSSEQDPSAHVMDVDLSNEEGHALAHVAFVCELTYQFLAGASADTTPLLIRPLRNIMRVLELIPSEAQFVGSTVRLSLRSAKYQPLEPEFIEPMLSCLIESMHGELWTERATALQFLQYFWFRNAINMGEDGSEKVLNEAMRLLEDSKLEVREMACDTVSGVIRALSSERQATLRAKIVEHAKTVFPDRKRRRLANGSGSGTATKTEYSLQVRHGAVLGLRALVMSSPYEIPSWLPGILMALVRVGSEKGVVGKTVTECLSDFRRTHENLDTVKSKLSEEEWEAIRDVAVGASSYFV